jgi:hypothetical protein
MPDPAVRARHLKQTLDAIAGLPEGAAIRDRVGELVARDIETSNGFDWMPIGHDLALVRAERLILGAERQAVFARAVVNASFRGPLLGRLVESAMRLTGHDPAGWARWIPRAWSLVFSGCGTWAIGAPEPDGTVLLRLAHLPPALVADEVWGRSLAASLSAIVDLGAASGGVELEALDPVAHEATFVLRWAPAEPVR